MNATGWKYIFKFTFIQNVKAKAFKISTIVICSLILIMTVLLNILPGLILEEDQPNIIVTAFSIDRLYLADGSGITDSSLYAQIFEEFDIEYIGTNGTEKIEEYTETVKNGSGCMLVTITPEEGAYKVYAMRPVDESVSSAEAEMTAQIISETFSYGRLAALGLNTSDIPEAMTPVYTTQSIAGQTEETLALMMVRSVVPMISALVLFVLIVFYGQVIAQSVAMEKTSKVIELLLTSTKPLAVIIGKVTAIGLLSLMQFVIFIVTGILGFVITTPFEMGFAAAAAAGDASMQELSDAIGEVFAGFSPVSLVLIIVIFLLGFLFYALLAGLVGASVSRSEDLNNAMQPFAIVSVVGFYLAYMPFMFGESEGNAVQLLAYYFPLSSPFALPSALLTGNLSIGEGLLCILILAIITALVALFVAKVYEQMILHTGNRIKIKDLLGFAKK
ncbi:MAG: ABC transporter permease [Eubacterium sp.]|nr:ABC transporter permease [Eubacterium sp.]